MNRELLDKFARDKHREQRFIRPLSPFRVSPRMDHGARGTLFDQCRVLEVVGLFGHRARVEMDERAVIIIEPLVVG